MDFGTGAPIRLTEGRLRRPHVFFTLPQAVDQEAERRLAAIARSAIAINNSTGPTGAAKVRDIMKAPSEKENPMHD